MHWSANNTLAEIKENNRWDNASEQPRDIAHKANNKTSERGLSAHGKQRTPFKLPFDPVQRTQNGITERLGKSFNMSREKEHKKALSCILLI